MAGLLDIKFIFQNLNELSNILKDFEKSSENILKPAAEAIEKAAKNLSKLDLNKIDQNAVQAIKAQNTGFSVNKNGINITVDI